MTKLRLWGPSSALILTLAVLGMVVDQAFKLWMLYGFDIAARYGFDPAVMAHAFVNTRPFLTANIIGATRTEHIETALASLDVTLPPACLADIEALHSRHPVPCP